MAASPKFKIYREGQYVASVKDPVDGYCLLQAFGGQIREGHTVVVWDSETSDMSLSYDEFLDELRHWGWEW